MLGEVGDENRKPAFVQVVAEIDAHRALLQAVTAQCRAAEHGDVFKGSVVFVVVEIIRAGVVGDVQIRPAVIVVVSPNHAQAVAMLGIADARLFGNVFELAVAQVVKQEVGLALHAPGAALHQDSLEAAILLVAAKDRQVVHVEVHVARDEQVNLAVAIVVGPGRAGAESADGDPGFVGYVLKLAVAEIVVERIAAETGDINVRQARHCRSQRRPRPCPSLCG